MAQPPQKKLKLRATEDGSGLPKDGMGIPEGVYVDAKARNAKGPWRDNTSSPLYVPVDFRKEIDPTWYTETWVNHTPHSKEDAAEKWKTLKHFKKLGQSTEWERRIWTRVIKQLNRFPHDCAAFGPQWKGGAKFTISSIRLVYSGGRYDKYSQVKLKHDAEDILAFHGTKLDHLRSILRDGFKPSLAKDCWYGNGCYFTDNLPYSQHYINFRGKNPQTGIELPGKGHTVYLLACLLRPGNVKVVPPDATPKGKGYTGPYRDRGCEKGYDSHAAWVTPSGGGTVGFRPMTLKQVQANPNLLVIKEFVMFDPQRIVPRFIVGLKRVD